MKKKVSITIDDEILNQVERIAKKQDTNRSEYIEQVLRSQTRQIPVLILAAESKIGTKDKSLILHKGKNLIDHQIAYVQKQGYDDIYVSTNSQKLFKYLQDSYPEASVFFEKGKLGSAGSLRKHAKQIGRRFIFMYCDVLLKLRLNELVKFHLRNQSSMTLVLKSMRNPTKFGVVLLEGSKIKRFEEKPERSNSHLVYIGVGLADPKSVITLPNGKFELQLNNIENKYGYIYERECDWFDTLSDY